MQCCFRKIIDVAFNRVSRTVYLSVLKKIKFEKKVMQYKINVSLTKHNTYVVFMRTVLILCSHCCSLHERRLKNVTYRINYIKQMTSNFSLHKAILRPLKYSISSSCVTAILDIIIS